MELTYFSRFLRPLLPMLKVTPASAWSHSLSVLLLLFLPSPLLPPSSWSYLSPLLLSPTSYLSHLLLFQPLTVLPVPEPLLGTSKPLCLGHPCTVLHLATSKASFALQPQGDLTERSFPRSTGRPLLPHSTVDFPFAILSQCVIL